MSNKAWYEEEIAPVLKVLREKCEAKKVSLIAVVEYAHNYRAGTYYIPPEAGLYSQLVLSCAMHAPDLDTFATEAMKLVSEHSGGSRKLQ